ncbi:hypothetical protein ABT269_02535 [Streptomyces viridosporus]|uniref:hypothetical protein n=1 Tax=Streptomyces viridosporus TaxID=67581 RepID=UPI00331982F6
MDGRAARGAHVGDGAEGDREDVVGVLADGGEHGRGEQDGCGGRGAVVAGSGERGPGDALVSGQGDVLVRPPERPCAAHRVLPRRSVRSVRPAAREPGQTGRAAGR